MGPAGRGRRDVGDDTRSTGGTMAFRTRHVAVLVETSTSWGTRIVKGIVDYSREHGGWSIFVEPRGVNERLHIPRGWRGSGIIARVTTRALDREVEGQGIPGVNISWSQVAGSCIPEVIPDEEEVGRVAAGHLIGRGFRR